MVRNICGKETVMNNNLNYPFGMYEPITDTITVGTAENTIFIIRCKGCNSSVIFDDPNNIVSLPVSKGGASTIYQTGIEEKWIIGLCGCNE